MTRFPVHKQVRLLAGVDSAEALVMVAEAAESSAEVSVLVHALKLP